MTVKVITDSTSYIPADLRKEYDITEIPLSVNFPDESFLETEVDYDYYYNKIETEGIIPTSSQPSMGDMTQSFRKLLEQGHDVVAVFLSSLMSGTYEAAIGIRESLLKEFPERKIAIFDSRTNCMSLGYTVLESAKAAVKGFSLSQVSETASNLIQRMHFYFTPATLEYLRKGGRIGGAAALLGKVIKFRPVLFVDNGNVSVLRVSRSFRGAIDEIMKVLDRDFRSRGLTDVIVHHINFPEKALELKESIKERYGINAPVLPIGPVIGCHVGPGTIGLVYCTER